MMTIRSLTLKTTYGILNDLARQRVTVSNAHHKVSIVGSTFRDIEFLVLWEVGAHDSFSLIVVLSKQLFIWISWTLQNQKPRQEYLQNNTIFRSQSLLKLKDCKAFASLNFRKHSTCDFISFSEPFSGRTRHHTSANSLLPIVKNQYSCQGL